MKFKFSVPSGTALLTAEQLSRVIDILSECEYMEDEWVSIAGGNGQYLPRVRSFPIDKVSVPIIMEDQIEAYKLAGKLRDEAKNR